MLVFEERGKPEFPEKNLSEQSRGPTNSRQSKKSKQSKHNIVAV